MGRTRRKTVTEQEQPAADTSFDVATLERQQTAAEVVGEVAAGMAMPQDTQREVAHEHGHSHAERVTRREPVIQSGLTFHKSDVLAGVKQGEGFRLIDATNGQGEPIQVKVRDAVLAFAEKPSAEVTATLRDAGFRWQSEPKIWTRSIRKDSAWQDRAEADKVFEVVSKQIRTERGITHSVGMSG